MRIISKYQLRVAHLENIKITNEDLSKEIRHSMANQITAGIAQRVPVEVESLDEPLFDGYEFTMEMYIFSREQMKAIVDKVQQGTAREIMDALSVELDVIEDVNMLSEPELPLLSKDEAGQPPASSGGVCQDRPKVEKVIFKKCEHENVDTHGKCKDCGAEVNNIIHG